MTPNRARTGLLLVLAALLAACSASEPVRGRAAGSALWVDAETLPTLGADTRGVLLQAGVRELFCEAGRLRDVTSGGDGDGGVENLLTPLKPSRTYRLPVTLVVFGPLQAASDPDLNPEVAGRELAVALSGLRGTAEARGLTVVGYHLDVVTPADEDGLERFTEALAGLRSVLDRGSDGDLQLSLSVAPSTLELDGLAEVFPGVDFLVPFLYGPRPEGRPGPQGPRAWDLATAEAAMSRLAALGRPYLLGLGTAGLMQRVSDQGAVLASTRQGSLPDLLARPELESGLGGLDTAFRQRLAFRAQRRARIADWDLAPGDRLQVVRPAPSHLRAVTDSARRATPDLLLGQVYDRLPHPGEDLSLSLAEVAATAGAEEPRLDLEVEVVPQGRDRSRLRLRLTNRGPLTSDVAMLESNYVELHAEGGATVVSAAAGGFQRYQLQHEGEQVRDMRSLRSADGVRFYLPLSQPGEVVESGTVVLRGAGRGGPVARVSGRFSVPGGGEVELTEHTWPAAAVED